MSNRLTFIVGILISQAISAQINTAPVTGIANRGFIIVSIAGNKVYKSIDGAISFHAEPGVTLSDVANAICLDDEGYGFIAGNNGSAYRITPNGTSNFNYTLVQAEPVANIADDKGSNIPQVDLKQVTFTDRITGYLTTVTGLVLKTTDGGFHWKIQQNGGATAPVIAMAPGAKSETGVLVDGNGNVTQLNDKSMTYGSRFWYDELGRITLSQNAKQFYIEKYLTLPEEQQVPGTGTVRAYSYNLYDDIGRITEVGEVLTRATIPQFKFETQVRQSDAQSFITAGIQREITKTYYDIPVIGISLPASFKQENLRPLVASVTYQAKESNNPADYDHATFFDYDSHGNIRSLLQDNALLGQVKPSERFKRVDYDYDLVSGKVNKVYYQKEQPDQLIHKYEYDGDNRIVKVFTSRDAITWDRDVQYDYYAHGPLAKMLLGNNNAEQNSYIYTIQGWIKGVNGHEFSYALGYFDNDYKAINASNQNLSTPIDNNASLFNGNIATMTSNTPQFASQGGAQLTHQFRYDQLNRLTASNALAAVGQSVDRFKTTYAYDAGGNITNLKRFNKFGVQYDNMQYVYHNTDNNYASNTNKLRSVDDDVAFTTRDSTDIDDQNMDNYQYDDIGNLIQDKQEQIANIEWTVYSKIKSLNRIAGSTKPDLEFAYDASGNRVSKLVKPRDVNGLRPQSEWTTIYYVRDAGGNIMSIYEQAVSTINLIEQYLYGSNRLGVVKSTSVSTDGMHTIGKKDFELTDHLGNVRVTLNDRSFSFDLGSDGIIDYYQTSVTSAVDFLPFGMMARSFNSTAARHGYNGMEKDEELKGNGNSYTTFFRETDPRLCKWLTPDPKVGANESVYAMMGNNPIQNIDVMGDKFTDPMKKKVNELRSEIKKRSNEDREKLNELTRINNEKYGGKNKEYLKQINQLNANIIEFGKQEKELNLLENTSQLYDIKFDPSVSAQGTAGKTYFNEKSGAVTVVLGYNSGANFTDYVATFAHEMTHCYQFQMGRLSLSVTAEFAAQKFKFSYYQQRGGGVLHDLTDEAEGFKRSELFARTGNNPYKDAKTYYGSQLNMPKLARSIFTIDPQTGKTYGAGLIQDMLHYKGTKTEGLEVIIGWEKYLKLKK